MFGPKTLFFLFLFICSCDENLYCRLPSVECDPGGFSTYFVENRTDQKFSVEIQVSWALGEQIEHISVKANEKVQITEDAMIGGNPRPTDTFQSLEISIFDSEGLATSIYKQEPIVDALWDGGRTGSGDFGDSEYTLYICHSPDTDQLMVCD